VKSTVTQKMTQAGSDLQQGVVRELGDVASTTKEQITGVGQSIPNSPDPSEYADIEALKQEEDIRNEKRMRQLRDIINEQAGIASQVRQQQEAAWASAQQEAMQKENKKKAEQEKKGGIISNVSRKLKGRLGFVQGQGRKEKGGAKA